MANLKYKNKNDEWKSILSTRGPKGDNADITVNGSNLKEASFYAPVSSGLIGQTLISKGANQSPQWTNLAVVAGTNSYNDLDNKPTIPTTTEELISGCTSVLTSGGAYNAFAQRGIPSGGSAGQIIKKASATDYDFSWADACIDNLTSTSITTPLSANQGKILNDKFANYLPLTGGIVNGTITANDLRANIDSGESSVLAAYQNKGIYLFANENSHGIYDNFFGPTMALKGTGITDKHFYGTATAAQQDTSGLNLAGAIIGGDSGGDNFYIKYSNGILICVKRVSFSNLPISSTWGNLYEYSGSINLGNWPYAFAYAPATSITAQSQSGLFVEGHQNVSTSSAGTVWISRPTTSTSVSGYISVIGIGKWKTDTTGGTIHEPEKTT